MPISLSFSNVVTQMNSSGTDTYTLSDVYDVVHANPTYSSTMTKTTEGDYTVYSFLPLAGQDYRAFTMISGARLIINKFTKLTFTKTNTTPRVVLSIGGGSVLTVGQDVIIDCSVTLLDGANMNLYGLIKMIGKADGRITITHHKYNYIRPYAAQQYLYVDFTLPIVNASIDLYIYGELSYIFPVSFKYIRHYTATSHFGQPIYFTSGNYSNITYEDFLIWNKGAIQFEDCNAYLKNGNISCPSPLYAIQLNNAGKISMQPYNNSQPFNRPIDNRQCHVILLNITFIDCGSTAAIYAYYNSYVLMKNCTIERRESAVRRGIYVYNASTVMLMNVILTNLSTKYVWNTSGTLLHVSLNTITVLDNDGNAMQYANVSIWQYDHKLNWSYLTDVNGQVLSIYNTPLILANKELYALDQYVIWCNANDITTYHYVIVSCPGYLTYTARIDTNINNDIEIRLTPIKIPIQSGDERMLYLLVQELKTALLTITDIKFIGFYPYDYAYIINRLPCVLIKFGNTNVSSPDGLHTYDVLATTLFILYSNLGIELSLDIELSIITKLIETLHNNSTYCINGISDTAVLAGDINEYISPDTTGYNANVLVRKIIQSYQFRKII